MTNEDLAVHIQVTGDYEYICQLWERVYKLIRQTATRYKYGNQLPTVVDVEDFIQCGYFAMIKAVEAFNTSAGWKFNTYLGYYLKHVRRSLAGPVTPITEISLNEPIADGGAELADIIPDETVELDSNLEREEIGYIISDELNKLPSDEAYAIIEHWYHNASINDIAEALGITYTDVRRVINRGLRKLRKSRPLFGIFLTYYAGADYLNEYKPHVANRLALQKSVFK